MNRRRFIAASTVGIGALSAGCSVVGGTTELGPAGERLDDDGMEKLLHFEDGDEEVAVVALDQMTEQPSPTDRFRLRIHVEHGTGEDERASTVERFRFDLRAPPTSVSPPADVYLRAPSGGLWPDFTYEEVDDLWTRIEADDVGAAGGGTLTLSLIVDPRGTPADVVGFRGEIDLSEAGITGTNYRLEAQTRFEPVVSE